MDSQTPPNADDPLHGYYMEDLEVGMTAVYGRTIAEGDVSLFAGLCGDDNPLHVHEEFASRSRFEGRIVHGAHTASLISAVLGTRMPGPGAIYLSQNTRFKAPVRIGDTVNVLRDRHRDRSRQEPGHHLDRVQRRRDGRDRRRGHGMGALARTVANPATGPADDRAGLRRYRRLRLRRLRHAVRFQLRGRSLPRQDRRPRRRAVGAVAAETAAIHLASQPDGKVRRFLARHGRGARPLHEGRRPRRSAAAGGAHAALSQPRSLSGCARLPDAPQGSRDQDSDPVERFDDDAGLGGEERRLDDAIDAIYSVDRAEIFKPHHSVYQIAVDELKVPAQRISFQSANGWDAHGAAAFGFRVAWINRFGQPAEALPGDIDAELSSLADLPALVGA